MRGEKENIKKLYSDTNKYLYTNKAKRECKLCYFSGRIIGLQCPWVDKDIGLCRNILIKDIEYMIEG